MRDHHPEIRENEKRHPGRDERPGCRGVGDDAGVSLFDGSFPQALRDWVDFDVALYALGRALGVFAETEPFRDVKAVFWVGGPLGDALLGTLRALVEGGVLEEKPGDAGVFRWAVTQPARRAD